MKLDQLNQGDHIQVTLKKRGARTVNGALIESTGIELLLICDPRVNEIFTTIPVNDIMDVVVVSKAAHAVYDETRRQFEYGTLIVGRSKGHHCYGHIVAAWNGTAVAKMSSGSFFKISAFDAYRA